MLHRGSSTRQSFAVTLLFAFGLLINGRPSRRASCRLAQPHPRDPAAGEQRGLGLRPAGLGVGRRGRAPRCGRDRTARAPRAVIGPDQRDRRRSRASGRPWSPHCASAEKLVIGERRRPDVSRRVPFTVPITGAVQMSPGLVAARTKAFAVRVNEFVFRPLVLSLDLDRDLVADDAEELHLGGGRSRLRPRSSLAPASPCNDPRSSCGVQFRVGGCAVQRKPGGHRRAEPPRQGAGLGERAVGNWLGSSRVPRCRWCSAHRRTRVRAATSRRPSSCRRPRGLVEQLRDVVLVGELLVRGRRARRASRAPGSNPRPAARS